LKSSQFAFQPAIQNIYIIVRPAVTGELIV
jgi:hypothetical protein